MITVSVAALKGDVEKYLQDVERGETIEVQKDGKPVAIVSPARRPMDRWKRANPLTIEGLSLSQELLADRERSS